MQLYHNAWKNFGLDQYLHKNVQLNDGPKIPTVTFKANNNNIMGNVSGKIL